APVWLLPAEGVRAHDAVDRIRDPEPPPVLPRLVVAARERVGDEHDLEALRLAPAERRERTWDRRRHEVERNGHHRAQSIHLDVVDADGRVAEPVLVPAEGLLSEDLILTSHDRREVALGRASGFDFPGDPPLVPGALPVLASQGFAQELVSALRRRPAILVSVAV